MTKPGFINLFSSIIILVVISLSFTDCKKTENPIKFPFGTFPDTVVSLTGINSNYDDYNLALYQVNDVIPVIFSSNRKSAGGQFDLEQGSISFTFDKSSGAFSFISKITTDTFLEKLITKAQTAGNDFGPYRLFSKEDGYEYLLLSSVNQSGNLDFYYLKNSPLAGSVLPDISTAAPIKLLNTTSDDAYLSFNSRQDTLFFSSKRDGDFDIFCLKRPDEKELSSWFNLDYAAPVKIDVLNSSGEDKCPFIFRDIMIFASDRPGGLGGYDLYYSFLKNGNWMPPLNFGPGINTSSDEYRPVIGYNPEFTNKYMMFSSNRPGGKGGFDLYFTGIELISK